MAAVGWCNNSGFETDDPNPSTVHSDCRDHIKNDDYCHDPDVYMKEV